MPVLLEVKNLKTRFKTDAGLVKAVDGISYKINENEIVGLVGESGCGKSVSQLSVMQLIPSPPGQITSGEIFFEGSDLLKFAANGSQMRKIRGGKIAMIFQEPMTSLNPVMTIGRQISEAMQIHLQMSKKQARQRAVELLELVGIPDGGRRLDVVGVLEVVTEFLGLFERQICDLIAQFLGFGREFYGRCIVRHGG